MSQRHNRYHLFRRLSVITLISVYLLILVGGIVRSTGSGMGCPDWPKCFGSWVPPTQESQLPVDYKEVYAQQRAEKNQRFVKYLGALGFEKLAAEISHDPDILQEEDFNAAKTWTEYFNRLTGVLVGLLVFATFLASLGYWQEDKTMVFLSCFTLLTVGFQGWIGSVVVSTRLLPWMITVHMLLALVIVGLLTYMVVRARASGIRLQKDSVSTVINASLVVALVLTLIQIILGTQVRESVNEVAETFQYQNRDGWMNHLSWVFYVHRSYSLLVLAVHVFLGYKVFQNSGRRGNLMGWMMVLIMTVVLEMLTGAVMAYFGIPRFVQPLHLLLAMIASGIQFFLILHLNSHRLIGSKISTNLNEAHVSYQNYG